MGLLSVIGGTREEGGEEMATERGGREREREREREIGREREGERGRER